MDSLNNHLLPDVWRTMIDGLASHQNSSRAASSHRSAAGFSSDTSLVLRSVDPVAVAKSIWKHEKYELEVRSEQAEAPSGSVVPYVVAIDRSLFGNLIFLGNMDKIAPGKTLDNVTNSHVNRCIASIVEKGNSLYDLSCNEHSLSTLILPNHVNN